ncbi:MAG: hypothetical protein LUH23_03225 [Oscillospiraceae bacterium]|nr:hypothetical protein [Oscillospiraceae bacterium]
MQTRLKNYAAIVLAAVVTFAVLSYFAPKQLEIPDGEEIYVSYVEPTLEVIDMDSTARVETADFHFSPGDDGYDELIETLEGIAYHNCLKTLIGSTSVSDIDYVIYVWVGEECYCFYDRGYLIADKIYYVAENSVENIRNVIM